MSYEINFSVVIPCYNDAEKIRRSAESCLSQSYAPYEVIIVDDGSNSETVTTIQSLVVEYHSKKLRAIFLKKNMGVSHARNTGMKESQGNFICLLDSDDFWHPEKLMIAQRYLKSNGEKIVLSHGFTYDLADFSYVDPRKSYHVERINFAELLFRNPITTPSLVIPSHIGITFRNDMRYAEDHEFLLRLSRLSKIFFIPEKLVYIDRALGSSGGLSGEKWKMRLGEMKMYFVLCKSDWRFYILFPFLIAYSVLKHVRKLFLNGYRSILKE